MGDAQEIPPGTQGGIVIERIWQAITALSIIVIGGAAIAAIVYVAVVLSGISVAP
jgi:hypothetical protein